MKKRIVFLLIAACLFALSACGQTEENALRELRSPDPVVETPDKESETARNVWKEPPELTVSCSGESTQALKCTYSWMYQNEDGTGTGINACGSGPLQAKEHMQPLDTTMSESNIGVLKFDLDPDTVKVVCWSTDCWGQYDVVGEEIPVETLEVDFEDGTTVLDFFLPLKSSSVYEVTAKWDQEEYGGTVYYGFCTT